MAKNKKNKESKDVKNRKCNHILLLYPEDPTHMAAIDIIRQSYDYALILHDRDIFTKEDELLNEEHKEGTFKKPHYHVVVRFNNARWNTAVAKDLGITDNYVKGASSLENSLTYLIHLNNPEKAQYDIKEVEGNLTSRLLEAINKTDKSEGEKVLELLEYIENYEGHLSYTHFTKYCAVNGYWSEYRRSGSIFSKVIDEHNYHIELNKKRMEDTTYLALETINRMKKKSEF